MEDEYHPDNQPAFEVFRIDGGVITRMKVWGDGRIEGFPEGFTGIINRIPSISRYWYGRGKA